MKTELVKASNLVNKVKVPCTKADGTPDTRVMNIPENWDELKAEATFNEVCTLYISAKRIRVQGTIRTGGGTGTTVKVERTAYEKNTAYCEGMSVLKAQLASGEIDSDEYVKCSLLLDEERKIKV